MSEKICALSGRTMQPSDDSAGRQSYYKGPRVLAVHTPSTLGAEGCVSHPGPGLGVGGAAHQRPLVCTPSGHSGQPEVKVGRKPMKGTRMPRNLEGLGFRKRHCPAGRGQQLTPQKHVLSWARHGQGTLCPREASWGWHLCASRTNQNLEELGKWRVFSHGTVLSAGHLVQGGWGGNLRSLPAWKSQSARTRGRQ